MKIICVGRNYADHAKELKNEVPKQPVIFLKPDTALLRNNAPFYHPDFSNDIHYECEVLVRINRVGKRISEEFAHKYYQEIGLGIDFTARDIQQQQKEKGLPWEIAKGFDGSAVVGEFMDKTDVQDINALNFSLHLNGQEVQAGNTSDMLFSIDKIISYVSLFYTLKVGDIIFTGTPAGVSKVNVGDELIGYINEKEIFTCDVR